MAEPQRVIVEKRGGCGSGCATFLLVALVVGLIVEAGEWVGENWVIVVSVVGGLVLVGWLIWLAGGTNEEEGSTTRPIGVQGSTTPGDQGSANPSAQAERQGASRPNGGPRKRKRGKAN